MEIFAGFLGVLILIIFVIFIWEMGKLFLIDLYFRKQTIEDVKENIITCLDEADGLGYVVMFRTPECVAYKNCKLHIATTENGKKVIMVDLI
jgi:hypothetical protein